MNIVFMGTPEFAVPCLSALLTCHNVLAVVTQPDREKGRGKKLQHPPVKEFALANSIPVLQPERIRNPEFAEELKKLNADIFVVVAYGQILPEAILNMPKYGCINVHGSLLPKYRGAAPIQWAVINGEKLTGVTIMHMDKGLDTGDMILKAELEITEQDTGGSVHDKMSRLGAETLLTALVQIEAGTADRVKQNSEEHTYAPMLTKELGHIDWNDTCEKIVNLVRGLNPWPTAYFFLDDTPVKVWGAEVADLSPEGSIGEIIEACANGIMVKSGTGAVLITEIQAQGGKRMPVRDYLLGHSVKMGTILK